MPNFHTHWLVAARAIDHAPADVSAGWDSYRRKSVLFGEEVLAAFQTVDDKSKLKAFRKTAEERFKVWKQAIGAERNNNPPSWTDRTFRGVEDVPTFAACRDDVTCFSAYMLGACGPDFWALPSEPPVQIPDVALEQFNLGHYNRSHRQFQASASAIGNGASLQARVQRAYFSGMATHLAADLIIHELVNVSAGAYNLLHQLWFHEEKTGALGKLKKWTMHNKVEHFWDTYVRYAKFGDMPDPFLAPGTPQNRGASQEGGFLTLDTLLELKPALAEHLQDDDFRRMIERPLTFPWMFCDRMLAAGGIRPFIYDVVINRAHPVTEVHPVLAAERQSGQMSALGGRNEGRKLEFFSSKLADGDKTWSWNYLLYWVCPGLGHLRSFGQDVFYDLGAIEPFVQSATTLAGVFLGDLTTAYAKGPPGAALDDVVLPNLGQFWNLDTGLGLQVKNVTRRTEKEIVTVLDFVHATSVPGVTLEYARGARDTGYLGLHKQNAIFGAAVQRAFEVRPDKSFKRWGDVEEPDQKAYLRRIFVGDEMSSRPTLRPEDASGAGSGGKRMAVDDALFDGRPAAASRPAPAPTQKLSKQPKIELAPLPHRLTLGLRLPIARLGSPPEDLGAFLYADGRDAEMEAENAGAPSYMGKEMTEIWMNGEGKTPRRAVPIEFQKGIPDGRRIEEGVVHVFTSRLLVNLDPHPPPQRKVKKGEWNNVIPYDAHQNRHHYGRNYAVTTGRKWVLHATDPVGTVFDPRPHDDHHPFQIYSDAFPTEQVFLSLHVLVKALDGKVYDAITRKEVARKALADIRRIDAAGFVKLVLYYVLRPDGAFQLDTCHIDGVPVRVKTDG